MTAGTTGPRSEVRHLPPLRDGSGSSRRWRRTLRGVPHSFTAVLMPDGERRYFVTRYNGYCDDGTVEGREFGMRFACAWSPVSSWTVRPERPAKLAPEERAALLAEAREEIAAAKRHSLTLKLSDFRVFEGALTVDGMPPRDWIEAVSGLHEVTGPDGLTVLVENE